LKANVKTTITPTPLKDLFIVEVQCFSDERGFFLESWNKRDFAAAGLNEEFVQDSHSRSSRNVLRGLHYQNLTAPMAKLVRCTRGAIFDVVVDLRMSSPTFGKWYGMELTEENKTLLLVPVGFAHGFATLSELAEVQYKQTNFYAPSTEGTLAWNDPDVGVRWPIDNPILSMRDQQGSRLRDYRAAPAFP
jgi:dTDP-4-dehydrorhamnose 3,5-epimerase